MTARKHLPVVQPDRVYESNYAMRKQIADAAARELAAAIDACGDGADSYGKHIVHDKLGVEATRSVYCRRDDGVWSPPSPSCEDRIFKQSVVVTTPSGIRYETHAVTVPAGQFAEHAVTHLPRRYDVCTAIFSMDGYKPRTPEQMKAAAERRRAKAQAEAEAQEAKEAEQRRAAAYRQPSLFGDES